LVAFGQGVLRAFNVEEIVVVSLGMDEMFQVMAVSMLRGARR
jgi:hypothetical protein